MTGLVRALAGTGKAAIDLVAALLISVGGFLMIGAYVFRVFLRPEWTSGQAVTALWPFFAVGSTALVLGWLVDRTAATAVTNPRSRQRAATARDASPVD